MIIKSEEDMLGPEDPYEKSPSKYCCQGKGKTNFCKIYECYIMVVLPEQPYTDDIRCGTDRADVSSYGSADDRTEKQKVWWITVFVGKCRNDTNHRREVRNVIDER